LPLPLHMSQIVTLIIWPSIVWRTLRSSPEPPHLGHVVGSVPGSAPLPPHVGHFVRLVNSISFSAPEIDSAKVRRRS
jgi:hypothetical protein